MRVTIKSIPQKPETTYTLTENLQSWETWHRRFGHISYTGLQMLWEENLVNSFNVDVHRPKLDCVACTEAKLAVEPYKKTVSTPHQANYCCVLTIGSQHVTHYLFCSLRLPFTAACYLLLNKILFTLSLISLYSL